MTNTLANILGFALMGVAGVSVAGLNLVKDEFAPIRLDPVTLCPVSAPISEHVALLIDRTDPMPEERAHFATDIVRSLARQTPVQGRLSVYLLTDDVDESATPSLDLCNPGDGSSADPLFTNARRTQTRFENGFTRPVDELAFSLTHGAVAPQSPIIETIASIAEGFVGATSARRIVVASDFLQHTDELSHYRQTISVDDALASRAGQMLADGRLEGVELSMIYLDSQTSPHRQGDAHIRFWRELITRAGGSVRDQNNF